jgi:hemoglobin
MQFTRLVRSSSCVFIAGLVVAAAAHAQPAPVASAAPVAANVGQKDAPLYVALGGEAGLTGLVDDLLERLLLDKRTRPFFQNVDAPDFKHKLVMQLCDVSGGPCKTVNTNMKKTHAGQDIRRSDFNALVEVLQETMSARDIAFSDQNQLLARLAPMHRDIVNTH